MTSSFRFHIAESIAGWPVARAGDARLTMYHDKLVLREHLEGAGVPLAGLLGRVGPLASLRPEHLAAPVVLKATRGHSGQAVRALQPRGDGWYELVTGRVYSFGQIVAELRELVDRTGLEDQWFLEELLEHDSVPGRVADDLKVYAFQGETPLVLHRRAGRQVRYRWYDSTWAPVETGKYACDESLRPPSASVREQVIATARRLSLLAPRPFVRVDLLITPAGPRVGELTPHPGGYQEFDDDWDRHLGECWARARLVLDARSAATQRRLDQVLSSRSWRVTAPLRAAGLHRRR